MGCKFSAPLVSPFSENGTKHLCSLVHIESGADSSTAQRELTRQGNVPGAAYTGKVTGASKTVLPVFSRPQQTSSVQTEKHRTFMRRFRIFRRNKCITRNAANNLSDTLLPFRHLSTLINVRRETACTRTSSRLPRPVLIRSGHVFRAITM